MTEASDQNFSYRLRREASGAWALLARWRAKRWVQWLIGLLTLMLLGGLLMWVIFARNLPSAETLLTYEPLLPTNVRSIDGTPIHSYARERRVQLSYAEYPPLLVRAFLAAEDRTFFEHGGLDYPGIVAAMLNNLTSDGRPVGASTITQQVAKNLLLTNELSYVRKVKEAILAKRIESVLTKQQIMELYLNQIALGRQSFGVQAAARAYFDKDVETLSLPEMAFLAILPKAPSTYSRDVAKATARRNFVLSEMERNGFITTAQKSVAQAAPLGIRPNMGARYEYVGGYYMEEVRRQLIDKYGENADGGRNPYSVYGGGLWVRTSFNPAYQEYTQDALRAGLIRYDGARGWRGPDRHDRSGRALADEPCAAQHRRRLQGLADRRRAVQVRRRGGDRLCRRRDGNDARRSGVDAQARHRRNRLLRDRAGPVDRGRAGRQCLGLAERSRSVGRHGG
jgi:penicillin-binding protein 1A